MKQDSQSEPVTELEGMVLAILAREGALTAYEIKEQFRQSPSRFWSGSAGAVYPLTKRLEQRGVLVSKDASESKRPRRVFFLTAQGRARMLEWLSDVERAADPGYDPLRSRLQFLDLLPKNDQREFLNDVEAALDRTKAPISKANPVQSLHKVWKEGRRNWFRHFRDALKK